VAAELNDADELQRAIREAFGCECRFTGCVRVGDSRRDRIVAIFALQNFPEADQCYAWADGGAADREVTTVLRIPPVTCAAMAVKIALQLKRSEQTIAIAKGRRSDSVAALLGCRIRSSRRVSH